MPKEACAHYHSKVRRGATGRRNPVYRTSVAPNDALYQYALQILLDSSRTALYIALFFNDIESGNQAAISFSETDHGRHRHGQIEKENQKCFIMLWSFC
jgi:hypothetical protein